MAKGKLKISYWRRQAVRWQKWADHYKRAFNVEQGLRNINEALYDTQLEWLKKTHPDVYTDMLKVFPDVTDDPEFWKAFD